MAGGQAIHLRHPVRDWKLGSLTAQQAADTTRLIMGMTEDQMLSFVPPYSYNQFCECPNCHGGVEGNNVLSWSIERPDQLLCRFCGTVVFPNPAFPETETLTGANPMGETVSFRYHYDAKLDVRYFLSTHLWLHRRRWLTDQITLLAQAYAGTGDERCARRVAVSLDRFAAAYPHYPVMRNTIRAFSFREQQAPFHWDSGRWNFFHNEVPVEVIPAYDLTYSSAEFDRLSTDRGYDVRDRVENGFLKAATEAAMRYPDYVSNVIGYSPRSAALLGQVIAEPRYVHWAFGWMMANVNQGFGRDGMWHEGTPSYHAMTVGGLQDCFEAVQGYTDPPGYIDPVDGVRFDNLDPAERLPLWAKCLKAPERICAPTGESPCIHDSWYYERRCAPRDRTVSTILPAFGHVALGRGVGPNQMQAHLHFSGAHGHAHYDALSLLLWAKGREMLPDLGYTWTQMRYWTASSLAHNLVVVNRQDQDADPVGGSLLFYLPGDAQRSDGLSICAVEAEAPLAYRGVGDVDLYRRTLVTVPVSARDAYVVDVFRVRGGRTHDWTLNGSADEDTTINCSLPLQGRRKWMLEHDEPWAEPRVQGERSNAYGFVRDVAWGDLPGAVTVAFAAPADASRGLLTRLFAPPGEIWLGRSPSVRRMGVGAAGDGRLAHDFWMPKLVVRRQGEAPLQSTFAAVHEPWEASPFLAEVRRLTVTPDDGLCVAVQVTHGQTTDTIVSTADSSPCHERTVEGGIRVQGRLAVVRQCAGKVTDAWLVNGTRLGGDGWSLDAATAELAGDITGAARVLEGAPADAFLTSAELPAGDALRGRWLCVTLPDGRQQGYEISRVERTAAGAAIVLCDDHGLRIAEDTVTELHFPARRLQGACRFRLPGLVSLT